MTHTLHGRSAAASAGLWGSGGWASNSWDGDSGTVSQGSVGAGNQATYVEIDGNLLDDGVIPASAIVDTIAISFDYAITAPAGNSGTIGGSLGGASPVTWSGNATGTLSGTIDLTGSPVAWSDVQAFGAWLYFAFARDAAAQAGGSMRLVTSNYAAVVTYHASVPSISAVSPADGATAGGTVVTLTGSGFTGATGVTFGGSAAAGLVVVSDTVATCIAPAHAVGAVDVTLTTAAGSGTRSSGYTYVSVDAVSPAKGDCAGGTTIRITGSGFGFATGVTIGGTAAASWTLIDTGTIEAVTPAHGAGPATITVEGVGSLVDGFTFTYTLAADVTATAPNNVLPPMPIGSPVSGAGGSLSADWIRWLGVAKQRIEGLLPASGFTANIAMQGPPVVPWDSVLKDGSSLADLADRDAGDLSVGTLPDGRLSNTGVTAGIYGDATHISRITVDAHGRITAASNVTFTAGPSPAKIAARISLRVL